MCVFVCESVCVCVCVCERERESRRAHQVREITCKIYNNTQTQQKISFTNTANTTLIAHLEQSSKCRLSERNLRLCHNSRHSCRRRLGLHRWLSVHSATQNSHLLCLDTPTTCTHTHTLTHFHLTSTSLPKPNRTNVVVFAHPCDV